MEDYPICLTARLDAESQEDNVSITNVVEKLDIELLLQRAQQGILDLRTFQRPMQSDFDGSNYSPQDVERITSGMLDEPDTPMTRVFGVDRETAVKAQKEFLSVAVKNIVKKEDKPAPPEPSKDTDEGEEGKVVPPPSNS